MTERKIANGNGNSVRSPNEGHTERYRQFMNAAHKAHKSGDRKAARRLLELAAEERDKPSVETSKAPSRGNGKSSPLSEFRRKHPQYDDMDDQSLAEALHKKFYSDIPQDEFYAKLGLKSDTKPGPGITGGAAASALDGGLVGFGDEYLAGLSAVLGVQPDGQGGADWFQYQKPLSERYGTALNAIRDEQASFREEHPKIDLAAGIAGSILGPGKGGSAFVNAGKNTSARVRRGGTTGGLGGAAYGYGEGEGSVENRAKNAVPSGVLGTLGGAFIVGAGQGFNRAVDALSKSPVAKEVIPTIKGLRETAKSLYSKAHELGGKVDAPDMVKLAAGAAEKARAIGYDRQLHPRVAAVLDRMKSEEGSKSLADMEILRRVAKNAAESTQPDERRIASQIVDSIDNAVEGLGGGSAALRDAREVWGRIKRMEIVEEAIEKASLQDNLAAGLRTQFRALLRNRKKIRSFSDAEIKAIRQVAKGTAAIKSLRGLAKILSPTGLPGMAIAGGTAFAGPGVLPALSIAGAGLGARATADRLTRSAAERAMRHVGMSNAQRGIIGKLLMRPNKAAHGVLAPGLIGSHLQGGSQ